MLRILLFVEPKPLPEHLFRNSYWIDFPLQLVERLHADDPASYEFHVATPLRFRHRLESSRQIFGPRTYLIDETKLVRTIHDFRRTIRDVWISDFRGSTQDALQQALDDRICRTVPDVDWDIILSFGEACRYSFARGRFCLNLETSPFGRFPFKHSFFMDHCGLFNEAAPSRFAALGNSTGGVEPSELVDAIRTTARKSIDRTGKLPFARQHARYVLLPLQASNYSSFDAQGEYDTQLDYLFDVCSRFEPDIGIIVTEHPQVPSLDRDHAFGLVCRGLRDALPNVTYLPRAKFFPSASLSLLADVDGVWTLASNVGPVASLLGVPLGTSAKSHIAYAADAFTPANLERQLGRNTGRKAVFEWMFHHYLVPAAKIDEPGWMSNYLKRRHAAFLQHGNSLESFCPLRLTAGDFVDLEPQPNRPFAAPAVRRRALLEKSVAQFRAHQRWDLRDKTARGDGPTFVLLNDTAELETYRHLGCNHVARTIHGELEKIGFRYLYSINSSGDVRPDSCPDWALINGEGTFHHDSPRGQELLGVAHQLRLRGAKAALINALWDDNDTALAESLQGLDLVAVRDARSRETLRQLGIEAELTPDFSLPRWRCDSDPGFPGRIVFCDSIIYERARCLFDACLFLGGDYFVLDDRQLARLEEDGCLAAAPKNRVTPDVLTDSRQIASARVVVTGRFHAAVACVALRKPFLYVESNTDKITTLCRDVGVPSELLNVTREIDRGEFAALETRLGVVESSFSQYADKLDRYYNDGQHALASLFRTLQATSRVVTSAAPQLDPHE